MARQLLRAIEEIRKSMATLAAQRDEARRECQRLGKEAEELKMSLEEAKTELQSARMEVDFLTISHRLADNPDNLISARRRLQRLIAKIDRCVTLLKDDADIS